MDTFIFYLHFSRQYLDWAERFTNYYSEQKREGMSDSLCMLCINGLTNLSVIIYYKYEIDFGLVFL